MTNKNGLPQQKKAGKPDDAINGNNTLQLTTFATK